MVCIKRQRENVARMRSDTHGGGAFEVTVISAPHKNKRIKEAKFFVWYSSYGRQGSEGQEDRQGFIHPLETRRRRRERCLSAGA